MQGLLGFVHYLSVFSPSLLASVTIARTKGSARWPKLGPRLLNRRKALSKRADNNIHPVGFPGSSFHTTSRYHIRERVHQTLKLACQDISWYKAAESRTISPPFSTIRNL